MMVGNTLKQPKQKSEFYVDEIPIEEININTNKLGEKSKISEERKISMGFKFKEEMRENPIVGNTSEVLEDSLSQPSTSKFCSLKDKNSLRKFKRNNRCKYCRRLVGSPTTLLYTKSGKSLIQSRCNIRRPLEHTMDEVAWACGRIWCSVSRRKRRKIADNRTRKQINEAFSTLREILPPAEQTEHEEDSAAAKVSTLRLAASYIQALSDLLRETHLSDKSPRVDLKGNDIESEKPQLKCEEKLVSSAGIYRQKPSDDYPSSKGVVGPPTKFHKNCFKPDKQHPIVKNIPGKDSPLECV